MSSLDELEKYIEEKSGWIKAGYDEHGRLIQYNTKTEKFRVLDEWMEITEIPPSDKVGG